MTTSVADHTTTAAPIPERVSKQIIDFIRALRTGKNTPPEDAKIYVDIEMELEIRTIPD